MNVYKLLDNSQVKSDNVLLFDLDGTLIDTDPANKAAYLYAIKNVIGNEAHRELSELSRITRKDIAALDDVDDDTLNEIIRYKRWSFCKQLEWGNTSPYITVDILKQYSAHNPCYIITTAEMSRAQLLLNYYGLNSYVKDVLYVDEDAKYDHIEEQLGVAASDIVLFEDNESAIKNAISNGIREDNIIWVKRDLLKEHTISPNEYIHINTRAFYSLYYVGFGKPGNPNFINTIKNQYGNNPGDMLKTSFKELTKYIIRDIYSIYQIVGSNELTIVAIPRAKAESTYTPQQQLFRLGVQLSVEHLQKKTNLHLVDGSHYIIRHTNTKTTHLSKTPNVENDGDMPYVGITKDTCIISEQIAGKDVLLIDDIYTKTVNIDEDAIQALYDFGAKSVTFYSICRTL